MHLLFVSYDWLVSFITDAQSLLQRIRSEERQAREPVLVRIY